MGGSWREILDEIRAAGSAFDVVRRRYVKALAEYTGRHVIVYYSGWLQKSVAVPGRGAMFAVDDADKNGFMAAVHQLDRSKGLDLVLHTPGGSIAATESLVEYLRTMFGNDIRAVVPQLALSAGTMIALSCREILMGKQSSLGPIDPQVNGIPAHGVIEEFARAASEIQRDKGRAFVWQPIIAKYHPTLIGECEKAIMWSNSMVHDWLTTGMFREEADAMVVADRIVKELADHALTLSHDRHVSAAKAKELGIKVRMIEEDQALQDAVLGVHHACIQTLSATNVYKMIENDLGAAQMLLMGSA